MMLSVSSSTAWGDGHDLAGLGDPVDIAHALDGELGDALAALETGEVAGTDEPAEGLDLGDDVVGDDFDRGNMNS